MSSFAKLDGYLQKIDDPETTLDDKMKAFRNGMIRLKKTKKQINQTQEEIEKRLQEPVPQELSKEFNWIESTEKIEQLMNGRPEGDELDLTSALDQYLDLRGQIELMEKYLTEQRMEIKRCCDDYEEVRLLDITNRILKLENERSGGEKKKGLDQGVEISEESSESVEESSESSASLTPEG